MKVTASGLDNLETELKRIKEEFNKSLLTIPNLCHSSVIRGGASENKIVKTWGEIKDFSFKPLNHIELCERLNIIDFKRAAKICGSHFALFRGNGARLARALINFMLD